MSTFQSIVFSIIQTLSYFLPISPEAHARLLPYLLDWPAPAPALMAAVATGALLALLIYFIHDWSSIFSSLIQTVIFFRKPRTLDEHLPGFIFLTAFPAGAAWFYFRENIAALPIHHPIWIAVFLLIFSFPLVLAGRIGKTNKNLFSWNGLDSFIVGLAQLLAFIPGAGRQVGAVFTGFARNYTPEAIGKFTFLALLPFLLAEATYFLRLTPFGADQAADGMSWLSFWVALVVSAVVGFMGIGGFLKNVQKRHFRGYVWYRWVLAIAVLFLVWYRQR